MKTILKILITGFFASSVTSAKADDTDIYFPAESVSTSQNVLFVMDVSGSMRREVGDTGINRFEAMKAAFNNILNTVPPSLNVGLMNFGSIGSARNNFAQGVKFPVSPLTANARQIMEDGLPLNNDGSVNWNANNMPEPTAEMTVFDFLPEITNSWSPAGWTPLVDSIYEAALYFRGENVAWGLGPLEENGNEWVAHPSTYTGLPGGWNATACSTVWTERLPEGVIPAEYRCPANPANPSSPGTYANCAATATECIAAPGGGGGGGGDDAITVGNSPSHGIDNDGELSFSHTLASGNNQMVVVGVAIEKSNEASVSSITYGGVNMIAIANTKKVRDTGTAMTTQLFYLKEADLPADGAHFVEISHNGSYMVAGAVTINNVDQSGPEDEARDSYPNHLESTITTSSENAIIIDIVGGGEDTDDGVLEARAQQTQLWYDETGSSQGGMSTRIVESADSYEMGWDWNSNGGSLNRATQSVVVFASVPDTSNPENSGVLETWHGYWEEHEWNNSTSGRQWANQPGNNPVYTFTVTKGGWVEINLEAWGGYDDPYLWLVYPDGTHVYDDDGGSGRESFLGRTLSPGEYTIYAATYGSGISADLGLWVEGYVSNLRRVSDGYTHSEIGGEWTSGGGENTTSGDNQHYYFTVTQAGDVTIKLKEESSVNPYLYLLDANGVVLDEDDNSGDDSDDAELTTNLQPGTYRVIAATTDSTIGESGDFEIELYGSIGSFPADPPVSSGSGSTLVYPEAQYIKFESISAHYNNTFNPYATAAEFSLIDDNDQALDKNQWSLVPGQSDANASYPATNVFDGNVNTTWKATSGGHSYQIVIDLGATHSLKEFSYLSRQDGSNYGLIENYNIYLSADGNNWGSAVISSNFTDSSSSQTVQFTSSSGSGSGSGNGSGSGGGNNVAICHIPPGNPDNAHTLVVSVTAVPAHEAHGDLIGACGTGISSVGTTEGSCLYTMCSGAATTEPTYISPMKSACQSNAIILLSDGSPQAGSSVSVNATYDKVVTNNEWSGGLADAFRSLNCESSPDGFLRGKCGPELTNYIATTDNSTEFDGDQTIQVYTVGLGLGQGSAAENYLKSLSTVDDPETVGVEGYYSATNQASLITAFSEILSELELNTTTTAFSNPGYSIVAKAGLNHEDSVFIPTFEVGNNAVWKGNLKKFKIVNSNGNRQIRGQNNQNAVTELGAFTVGALDYWSTSGTADGTEVAKGGAASLLNPSARHLYTDINCTAGAVCDLAATNNGNELLISNIATSNANENVNSDGITNADLGLIDASANDRKKYICFIRGYEDYDQSSGECTGDARKHMGDMLHFEPLVVTYEREHDDRDDSTHLQVIFAGTNEGYLHAFDADSGEEVFAFMPEELLKNIKPQFDDNEYRGHKYGVDGFANVWVNDVDDDGTIEPSGENGISGDEDDEHVYLYFGLRRGGNHYYALDVTDPEEPKLMWKVGGASSGDFQYLGQTWSRPYLAQIHTSATDATLKPVLVFSGGYDADNQDKPLAERDGTDSVGADIFIVDAKNGDFIWSLKKNTSSGSALTHSVPGGVRILDMDKDGAIDRMYFADVVGNVWRLELDTDFYDGETDSNPDSLYDLDDARLIKLASLGGATDDGTEPRKFFNEPDVSISRKDGVTSLLVSIGSGDRTAPLGTDIIDRFYVLEDSFVTSLAPSPLPSGYTITEANLAVVEMGKDDEGAITLSNGLAGQSVLARSEKGWYLKFDGAGEKVLSNSLTNHGKVIFTTLVPDVYVNVVHSISACNIPATQGRAYVLDILEGNADVDLDGDGGAPDNDDLFVVVSANEIPGAAQLVFNEPLSASGSACTEGNCIQNVDLRSGKKLSQVMSYNAGILESVFWSKPQEK